MSAPAFDWSVASRPLPGQPVSGDQHLVALFPGGALLAVLDGLGHGPAAEEAARAAVELMRGTPQLPVDQLLEACHVALGRMRGVVMSLASFDASTARLTWVGVGNVEGIVLRAQPGAAMERERLLLQGGIVGQTLPKTRPVAVQLRPHDVVIFATDGVDSGFLDSRLLDGVRLASPAARLARDILERHSKGRDDSLVLVARYLGGEA